MVRATLSTFERLKCFHRKMLVRKIGLGKWHRSFIFMKQNNYDNVIVEEKYIYRQRTNDFTDLSRQTVESIWVYAILTIDSVPVMVTSRLGPEHAWCSHESIIKFLRESPMKWLEEDHSTLLSLPTHRRERLAGLLERAVSVRALGAPDQASLQGL